MTAEIFFVLEGRVTCSDRSETSHPKRSQEYSVRSNRHGHSLFVNPVHRESFRRLLALDAETFSEGLFKVVHVVEVIEAVSLGFFHVP